MTDKQPVQIGDKILPRIIAEWFNSTLPVAELNSGQGPGKIQQTNGTQHCVIATGPVTRLATVGITGTIDPENSIKPIVKVTATKSSITSANWCITREAGDTDNVILCTVWGITRAPVVNGTVGEHVDWNEYDEELQGSSTGKAIVLEGPNSDNLSLIYISNLNSNGGPGWCEFITTARWFGGEMTAKITRMTGYAKNFLTNQEYKVGDTITVGDPRRMWEEAEIDATGSATWNEFDQTANANRWEAVTCSLPVNEITVTLNNCVVGNDESGSADIDTTGSEWIRSTYPNVDLPPEITGGMVTFQNTWKLNGIENSKAVLKRVAARKHSEPKNKVLASQAIPYDVEWQLVRIEKPYAPWVRAFKGSEGWEAISWYGNDASDCDPEIAPIGDDSCAKLGTVGWGFVDPRTGDYKIVGTDSALLGSPETKSFVVDLQLNTEDCQLKVTERDFQVFPCDSTSAERDIELATEYMDVVTSIELTDSGLISYCSEIPIICGSNPCTEGTIPVTDCEE